MVGTGRFLGLSLCATGPLRGAVMVGAERFLGRALRARGPLRGAVLDRYLDKRRFVVGSPASRRVRRGLRIGGSESHLVRIQAAHRTERVVREGVPRGRRQRLALCLVGRRSPAASPVGESDSAVAPVGRGATGSGPLAGRHVVAWHGRCQAVGPTRRRPRDSRAARGRAYPASRR